MTNSVAVSFGGFSARALPLSAISPESWGQPAMTSLALQKAPKGRVAAAALSAIRPSFFVAVKPGAKQSVVQIKTSAKRYVEQCWKDYARLYPEAFSALGSRSKTTPELVFLDTQAEVNKAAGRTNDTEDLIAFVVRDDPSRVYVHTTNFVSHVHDLGPDYAKTTLSHELIHSLTNPVLMRMDGDLRKTTASYPGVNEDLRLKFEYDSNKTPALITSFSVRKLIAEFSADYFADKATGSTRFGGTYRLMRDAGKKLLRIVGEDVYRKAVLGNDPVAYRKVVEAAKTLQKLGMQEESSGQTNPTAIHVRASQPAVRFGTPLTATAFEKLESRPVWQVQAVQRPKISSPNQTRNLSR